MNATRTGTANYAPTPALFALLVVIATMVWIAAVWVVGVGTLVQAHGLRYDRLAEVVFPIWNTRPIAAHGFAGALTLEAFDRGIVYTGHPPAMLLAWYAIAMASARWFPGDLGYSTNLFPVVYAAVLSGAVGWFAWSSSYVRGRWSAARLGLFFLLLGFLLTSSATWLNLLVIHSDNPFPVVAYLMLPLVPFAIEGMKDKRRAAIVTLVLFALVGPIYVPVVLATLYLLSRATISDRHEKRYLLGVMTLVAALSVAGWIGPQVVARALGHETDNSSWTFRSGLDGDRFFLDTMFTAIVDPYPNRVAAAAGYRPRSGLELLGMPAVLLLVAGAVAFSRPAWRARCSKWVSATALLLLSPYLFSAVFFAQAMTIHPYMYDYFLQWPLSVLGGATMLHVARESDDDGRIVLLFGWLLSAGVMSNLIAIAQGMRTAFHLN